MDYGKAPSSTTAIQNLKVLNNGTWSDAFQFGQPDDITWTLDGMTFELDVQRNRFDPNPLLSLTSANGRIIVDDPVQRVIHFNVPAADLQENLDPGLYVYDLVMTSSFGVRTPLMSGTLEITQGVSYPP